jgi:alpha-tubulin suppressor-like RCC1 family protein
MYTYNFFEFFSTVLFPPLHSRDTKKNMEVQLKQLFPVPIAEIILDYAVVNVHLGAGFLHTFAWRGRRGARTVLGWGSTKFYGRMRGLTAQPEPIFLPPLAEDTVLLESAGGYDWSVVLDSNGCVWATGQNENGQLGLGTKDRYFDRTGSDGLENSDEFPSDEHPAGDGPWRWVISLPAKVVQIATGSDHTLFLTAEGLALSCGRNAGGQLGYATPHGNTRTLCQRVPRVIEAFTKEDVKIRRVGAGSSNSFFIGLDGRIYGCGLNRQGALGFQDAHYRSSPELIRSLQDREVVDVAGGSEFSLFLDAGGHGFMAGKLYGLKGDMFPLPDVGSPIVQIAARAQEALVLDSRGRAFAFSAGLLHFLQKRTPPEAGPWHVWPLDNNVTNIACNQLADVFVLRDGSIWTYKLAALRKMTCDWGSI